MSSLRRKKLSERVNSGIGIKILIVFIIVLFKVETSFSQGIVTYKSKKSFDDLSVSIVETIKSKNLKILEETNLNEAKGLTNRTKIITFEDQKLVTELLACDQTIAFELPFKILIWEEEKDVYVGFKDPNLLMRSYLLYDCSNQIKAWSGINVRIVNEALKNSSSEQ